MDKNIPGYYDGFEDEYTRRAGCLSDEYKEEAKLEMQSIKYQSSDFIENHIEYKYETIIELLFFRYRLVNRVSCIYI